MKMTILKLSLISALWLAGCTNEPAVDNGAQSSAAENAPPSNRIDIPATVRNNLGITFAQVQRRNVADTIRIAGAFEQNASDLGTVHHQVIGPFDPNGRATRRIAHMRQRDSGDQRQRRCGRVVRPQADQRARIEAPDR